MIGTELQYTAWFAAALWLVVMVLVGLVVYGITSELRMGHPTLRHGHRR